MEPPVADTTPFNPRAVLAVNQQEPEPEQKPVVDGRLWRVASWFGVMAIAAVAVVPMLGFAWQGVSNWSLANATPVETQELLATNWPDSSSADYLETISELSLRLPEPDVASAFVASKRAIELDPSRAFSWATLAYLETSRTGGTVNEVALDALTKSMDACPLCDQELIRWRFNYVLSHWEQMPEAIRARAFEQADLLRWNGPNAEFLAEMRYKAQLNNIAFDAYRAAVKTPARTWDIAPGVGLRGTRQRPA